MTNQWPQHLYNIDSRDLLLSSVTLVSFFMKRDGNGIKVQLSLALPSVQWTTQAMEEIMENV